jgi:hypothetical protein
MNLQSGPVDKVFLALTLLVMVLAGVVVLVMMRG